jgi:ribosomal protein S18 acetylase RimI-like enzyme
MPLRRHATADDLRLVASWLTSPRDCELWAGRRVRYPIDVDALPSALQFDAAISMVLVDPDARVVAFGQIVLKDGGRGHLARLIVDPRRRRNGYGEALVSALLDRASGESFVRVSLNVDEANAPAIALYEKLGFRDAPRPSDEPTAGGIRYLECC